MSKGSPVEIMLKPYDDHNLRAAIGGVCIHWAWLEMSVERMRTYLIGKKYLRYKFDLGNNLTELQSRVAKSRKLTDTQKAVFAKLVSEMPRLKSLRHRVAHGLWGKDSNGNYQSVFASTKRSVASEIGTPITIEDVRQIKLAIFRWYTQLQALMPEAVRIDILPVPYKKRKK